MAAPCLCWAVLVSPVAFALAQDPGTRRVTWDDVGAVRQWLTGQGMPDARRFDAYVDRLRETHARRVKEGDLDHLIFYALQSGKFTTEPPIEPALSAKALVSALDAAERKRFLTGGDASPSHVPSAVRSRLSRLLQALDSPRNDARLAYFRELVTATFPDSAKREADLVREYLRVMRFVYEKEFVAQRAGTPAAVAELYRTRGLSTDTAVEAGYLVHLGLGVTKALDSDRRIRRVLIVGPGLDLAPRTALHEDGPPESYQPWAVIDALVSLGLSRLDDLEVVAADINPRVVAHLRRAAAAPPALSLVSEIRDSETVTLTPEFREYFAQLGKGIGEANSPARVTSSNGHLRKTVKVGASAAQALHAVRLDIVTGHLASQFDLVIATNILPYFDDAELSLAMANIAAMIAPGGVFLHNEARPLIGDLTTALDLPLTQSRHATIATVRDAPPLFDSVFLHRKR